MTSTSVSGSRMSTPRTSAPITAVTGVISMVDIGVPPGAGRRTSIILSCLRILGTYEYVGEARWPVSPRFKHLDDLTWEEVRRQLHGDHTASVREKWLDFSTASSRSTRGGTRA